MPRVGTLGNLYASGGNAIAAGIATPTGGTLTIVTGLSSVDYVIVSFADDPVLTCMFVSGDIGNQSGSPAAGSFFLLTNKPTNATNDITPVDATTPFVDVFWIAIGDF